MLVSAMSFVKVHIFLIDRGCPWAKKMDRVLIVRQIEYYQNQQNIIFIKTEQT